MSQFAAGSSRCLNPPISPDIHGPRPGCFCFFLFPTTSLLRRLCQLEAIAYGAHKAISVISDLVVDCGQLHGCPSTQFLVLMTWLRCGRVESHETITHVNTIFGEARLFNAQ